MPAMPAPEIMPAPPALMEQPLAIAPAPIDSDFGQIEPIGAGAKRKQPDATPTAIDAETAGSSKQPKTTSSISLEAKVGTGCRPRGDLGGTS
eukprot:10541838-Alexandrium_andersonii.AAC.1